MILGHLSHKGCVVLYWGTTRTFPKVGQPTANYPDKEKANEVV